MSDLWPWFFFGGIVATLVAWSITSDDHHLTRWSFVGVSGLLLATIGYFGGLSDLDKPINTEWHVDQVQAPIMEGGYRLLIVNSRGVDGNMQPQYRQVNPPAELVELFQRLAEHPEVRSFVTVQCGQEGCIIPKVEVLVDRFSPPEIHEF